MGLRGRAAALAAVVLVAAAAAQAAPGPYAYDQGAPLAFRDAGRVNGKYPIAIHDVSYALEGRRVPAYLALPPGKARVPAVIFLHGAGEDRRRFLLPAGWVAGRDAVGMTLTLPSTPAGDGPKGLTPSQSLARAKTIFVRDVVAVRRAVDLLRTLPQVDPNRIGLVGWSLGARVGAVLAGVEPRFGAVVLMSGGASPISDFVNQAPAGLRPAIRQNLTPIDPLLWIHRARPGEILLQDGRKDQVVPKSALLALAHAAPKGTTLRWYPTDHSLNSQAYRDQLAFLVRKLDIRGPNVPGADTGP